MSYGNDNPRLEPTKVPTALDIAWAAGVYEGEGSICDGTPRASSRISVAQKDTEILYRLRDWFGGSVLRHCGKSAKPEQVCYKWCVYGDKCRLFTALIYGYLSARRRSQVDATKVFDFLQGESPVGMSVAQVQSKIDEMWVRKLRQNGRAAYKREWARSNRLKKWETEGKVLKNNLQVFNQDQERVM